MNHAPRLIVTLIAALSIATSSPGQAPGQSPGHPKESSMQFIIHYSSSLGDGPFDGRLLLLIDASEEAQASENPREPRFNFSDNVNTAQGFGIDVNDWRPGQPLVIDGSVFGYPQPNLAHLPAGDYVVQAILHKYETFHRSDGHTVKLPMDRGEGQHWNRAPGNIYSTPMKVHVDPDSETSIKVEIDQEIPPIEPPVDTHYIKHIKIQSKMLTEFWGRPMHLGAVVLIPHGFDEHPEARYPLVVNHGHFPSTFGGFRTEPPDPNLEPEYSSRFSMPGYNIIQQEHAYELYQEWISPDFPRFVIIEVQHANPFYDDSYAVNSENLGPYGDAIMQELIPAVEEQFRCIGEGWARFTYGGSTGGWEALAVQVLYPDDFNGCFAACPDPIDFHAYTVVDLYEDDNAYHTSGPFKKVPRPGQRNWLGHLGTTLEQTNHRELVLGTHSRSGDQWDIWEAVYSPCGEDGYPVRIWDKMTGEIDHKVAEYWRENFDLGHIIQRDWATLGPKLQGKIHIYCGGMDNYYLNNAVYLVEETLNTLTNPPAKAFVDYECRAEHCWNGDHERPNATSRLRYHQMYVERILERIKEAAPEGADLVSWRY